MDNVTLFVGAYYFYIEEKAIEDHKRAYMEAKADDVVLSKTYIADRLEYILYDQHGGYNNCTRFTDDPFYEPNPHGYSHVCLDQTNSAMNASRFCHCVWTYKTRVMNEVGPGIQGSIQRAVFDSKSMILVVGWDEHGSNGEIHCRGSSHGRVQYQYDHGRTLVGHPMDVYELIALHHDHINANW